MTRSIDAATQAASESSVIVPVYFVKLEFDGGSVCLHTQLGDITFGGDTYVGAGAIGDISPVDEDTELARSTLRLTLRGLPGEFVAVALAEYYQGRTGTVFLGYQDPDARQLVADPVVVYRGRMDTAAVQQDAECSVAVTLESRFAAWDRPLVRRYNDADQQSRYPGDRGLEFVERTTEKQLFWGQPGA